MSKALTRSYLARSGLTQTIRAYNPVRRTFYDVSYIYIIVDWGEKSRQLIALVKMRFGRELNPGLQITSRMP